MGLPVKGRCKDGCCNEVSSLLSSSPFFSHPQRLHRLTFSILRLRFRAFLHPYSSRRWGIRVTLGRLVLISDRANDVPPGRISCLEYGRRHDARANVTKPPPLFYGNLFKGIRETGLGPSPHELRISLETRSVHKISYLVNSLVEGCFAFLQV